MSFTTRLMLITAALLSHACIIYAPATLGFPRPPALSELEVEDSQGSFVSEKIVIIPIDGTISSQWQGSFFAPARNQVADIVAQLDLARQDDDVVAVVLRIDSPGGSVTASDQIHREILEFKQATGIPVIAAFMGTAASAGTTWAWPQTRSWPIRRRSPEASASSWRSRTSRACSS